MKRCFCLMFTAILFLSTQAFDFRTTLDFDVNGDGFVDTLDVSKVIDIILGNDSVDNIVDFTDDGVTDVTDVSLLIDVILGKEIDPTYYRHPLVDYVIFGTSKTATRSSSELWFRHFQLGMMQLYDYTSDITVEGHTLRRPHNYKCYNNTVEEETGKKVTGVGSSLSFHIKGSHVNIVQFIERTDWYATFDIYDNGKYIGSFDNQNHTMQGEKVQTFVGDGEQRTFIIDHLDSYAFNVTVDGVPKKTTMYTDFTKTDIECFAVRTVFTYDPYNDGEPHRILYFPEPPAAGSEIKATYQVGHAIGFTKSDFHEDQDSFNESLYPVTTTSLNSEAKFAFGYPITPMISDSSAVISIPLEHGGVHEIKLVITGGVNPYFDFDFACVSLNRFMNAAFRGYDLRRVITEPGWRDWRSTRYMPDYDVLILEHGTNDDRYEIDRVHVSYDTLTWEQMKEQKLKDVKTITRRPDTTYVVGLCTGRIDSIAPCFLISNDVKTSDVQQGDYLKIGEYHSHWHEFAVRRITSVDKELGLIGWDDPFTPDSIWHYDTFADMKGAQFSVRRLDSFKANYRTFLSKLKAVNSTCETYLVGISPYNNNDYCSGWGYNEAIQDLAAEWGYHFIQMIDNLLAYSDSMALDSTAYKFDIVADGGRDYELPASVLPNLNRTMLVYVNGQNVTGHGAWIERNDGWFVSQEAKPNWVTLNETHLWHIVTGYATNYLGANPSRPLKVHFYGTPPAPGDNIQVVIAQDGWCNDGMHQTDAGNQIFGRTIFNAVKHFK